MKPIARRGDVVAYASEPFDPVEDEVELRSDNDRFPPQKVRWQSALKQGYWEPFEG